MGEVHALRIKSPYKLLHVEDIKIINKPNEHGTLYLKCLIDDSVNFKYSIEASTKDEITVYEESYSENNSDIDINKVNESKSTVLFNGLIESIKTTNDNGIYYLEINGISKTCELDVKEKSRSFQNINMTYDEIITSVLKDYSCKDFVQSVGCGQKISKPIFQHKETDWNFLKRICSELDSEIYCDIINMNNMLYFGINNGKSYEVKEDIPYKVCKDLKAFYKAGGYDEGFDDTDYFYYEIRSREIYEPGDKVYFKQKDVYVTEYSACKYQDEIIYKYRLCRKNGVWQTKLYNSLISGASLEGKVLAVQGEEVKLKLSIDTEQIENEAAWFKYAPPTGNTMYSMPIVGTSARLYFPDESGNEPLISGCVRNNGSSCDKTSDTTKRYFGTEHGSEVEMTPSAVNIKGGSASPISISIDDNVGITITSPKKLTLNADSEIVMKTPKGVKINGVSQINAQKTNTESGFSLETDLHFLSDNVIKDGSSNESYPDYEDDPDEGQMVTTDTQESTEEKGGFPWGKLAAVAIGVLAIAASVATFGAGAVVAGAIAGAAIGAVCAVAVTAVSDVIKGENSSPQTYGKNALEGAFWGAFTGAIFPPLAGVADDMGIPLITGMSKGQISKAMFAQGMICDSMSQLWDKGKLNLGESLIAGLFSLGVGKLLDGLGSLIQRGSSYVKNSFERILIENESSVNRMAKMLDDITSPVVEVVETNTGEIVSQKAEKDDIQQLISKIINDAKNSKSSMNSTSQVIKDEIIAPNETQVTEVNKVKDIKNDLKNSEHPHDYTKPGNFGEMKVDIDLESTGHYERINNDRVTSLDDPTHHGIDHVFKNYNPPPDYVIVDSKVLRADSAVNINKAPNLNNTKSGRQLSDKWIAKNIESTIEDEKIADEIIANLSDSNKVLRVTAKVDNTGKITYYKVGSDGKVIKEDKIPEIWIP